MNVKLHLKRGYRFYQCNLLSDRTIWNKAAPASPVPGINNTHTSPIVSLYFVDYQPFMLFSIPSAYRIVATQPLTQFSTPLIV